mgnify:FL=1
MLSKKIGIYACIPLLILSCQTLKKPISIAIDSTQTIQQIEEPTQTRIPALTFGEHPVFKDEFSLFVQSRAVGDSIPNDSIFNEF